MSLPAGEPVALTADSWVPTGIGYPGAARLLSGDEIGNITRDFSQCFDRIDLSDTKYYWMGNGWYNLKVPLPGVPSLNEHDTSAILEFRFEALRYSYSNEPNTAPARFLGQNFSAEFGEFTRTTFARDPNVPEQDCDMITAFMGQPPLPITRRIQRDGDTKIVGDFLLAEAPYDGGMVVLTSEILVLKTEAVSASTTAPGSTLPVETSTTHATSSTSTPQTTPQTKPNALNRSNQDVVIAVSVSGTSAVLLFLIGIALFMRQRRRTLSPIPPPTTATRAAPSKIEMSFRALTGKGARPHSLGSSRPVLATADEDLNEEDIVLRELRGAMENSGFTVNTLFERLAGPRRASISVVSDRPSVLPAYDSRH